MPQIAVLCDNQTMHPELAHEHGLSMVIVLDSEEFWLWDTGQSGLFMDNGFSMGINPGRAAGLALSHGHYDHTGGLDRFFEQTDFQGPVYAHPTIFAQRFSCRPGTDPRAIGLRTDDPGRLRRQLVPVQGSIQLAPGLTMFTSITRHAGNFEPVQGFYLDPESTLPDPVEDDAALVLDTADGPVLILGCCHSGLKNTCEHIAAHLHINTFHTLIGGLHLNNAPDTALEETRATIEKYGFTRVHAGHCTGTAAFNRLTQSLPAVMYPMGSGSFLEF